MSQHLPHSRKFQLRWLRGLTATLLIGSFCQPSAAQDLFNQASYSYTNDIEPTLFSGITNATQEQTVSSTSRQPLIDPFGQIVGCDGSPLNNYAGYTVALYEPDSSGLELSNLVPLTPSELPNIPNNGVPGGIEPNSTNRNPFSLTNASPGQYNFLLDPNTPLQSQANAGLRQTQAGARYILVVTPPARTIYSQRRVKLEILPSPSPSIIRYRATALDGIPLSLAGDMQEEENSVEIQNAEQQGLNLFALGLTTVMCEANQIQLTKSADRAAAQPGDTVVYRLSIRNTTSVALNAIAATDTLPPGFQLVPGAVMGQVNGAAVPVEVQSGSGSRVTFSTPEPLPVGEVLEVIYAARLLPDSLRGSGQNTAMVSARRADNGFRVQDGPSIHRLLIDPGILSDCGTLIGRVFEDKNFDGEQQRGEPGIPNAVVFLDDGNRVVTDADGLFSVQNMLPGQRSGTLDLSSLPGFTLAPNLYFNERNSPARLVNLAPGGLVRMNFAVTPAFQGASEEVPES